MLLHFDSGYSIIIPVTGLGGKKSKPENDSFIYVGGRPCAIGTREPCQAGNRAALSSYDLCRSKFTLIIMGSIFAYRFIYRLLCTLSREVSYASCSLS